MLNDKKSKGVHKFLEILLGPTYLMNSRGTPSLYQVSTAVVRCMSFTMESLWFNLIYPEVFFQPRTLKDSIYPRLYTSWRRYPHSSHSTQKVSYVLCIGRHCKTFHLDFASNLPSLSSNLGILNDDLNGTRRVFHRGTINFVQVEFDRQKGGATEILMTFTPSWSHLEPTRCAWSQV